jgi:hypothetical protein
MQMQHQCVSNNQSMNQMANFYGQMLTCPYSSFEDDIFEAQSKCQQ